MTAAAVVLVALDPLSRAEGSETDDVVPAMRSSLGAEARVSRIPTAALPTDADAEALAHAANARALVYIRWADDEHTAARLHVYVTALDQWTDRDLIFRTQDALAERERTVGFVAATMLLSSPSPDDAHAPGETASAAPGRATSDEHKAGRDSGSFDGRAMRRMVDADVGALGGIGVGGSGIELGPTLRLGISPVSSLALHVGGALTFGPVPEAAARATTTRLFVGGRVVWLSVGNVLAFASGVDVLAVRLSLARGKDVHDRWLLGTRATIGVSVLLHDRAALYTMLGADVLFGATPVKVNGREVAQLAPVRAITEVGVSMRF